MLEALAVDAGKDAVSPSFFGGELERGLSTVRKLAVQLASSRGLPEADAEDFCSEMTLKVVARGRQILEAFRGDGTFESYLESMVRNGWRDFLSHRFGKWRPSARALELGAMAVEFEQLTRRDGLGDEDAYQMLRERWHRPVHRDEIDAVSRVLPSRVPRQWLDYEQVTAWEISHARGSIEDGESRCLCRRVREALRRALRDLEPQQAELMAAHFWDGEPISRIAPRLGLPQRSVYTLKNRVLARLRRDLESAGLSWDVVHDLLRMNPWPEVDLEAEVVRATR